MTGLLNGPLEVGLRILVILDRHFPKTLNVDDLLVLDHVALHSGDFGGPESLHPALPLRPADVGARRDGIRHGLEMLIHRGLIEPALGTGGISFVASEQSHSVVGSIESHYLRLFGERVDWAITAEFAGSAAATRGELNVIIRSWPDTTSEEST